MNRRSLLSVLLTASCVGEFNPRVGTSDADIGGSEGDGDGDETSESQESGEETSSGDGDGDDTTTTDGDGDADTVGTCVPGDGICGPTEFCVDGTCDPTPPQGFVVVPDGSFMMGCDEVTWPDCEADELPYHSVTVSSFAISVLETTVEQYSACVEAGECEVPGTSVTVPRYGELCNWGVAGREAHPINCVSWTQADDYCRWNDMQLPTEAMWEKAARGSDGRRFPWGDTTPDCTRAVYSYNGFGCGLGTTWIGGSKPTGASVFDIMDIAGNVHEYVDDWYDPDYYFTHDLVDPQGPDRGSFNIARGGSLANGLYTSKRIENRVAVELGAQNQSIGFRCAIPAG